MQVADKQLRFLEKRRQLLKYWKPIMGITAVLLIGLAVWLYISAPLFANPLHTLERLESEDLDTVSLMLMAAMVPVLVTTILFLLLLLLLFTADSLHREDKYQKIVVQLQAHDHPQNQSPDQAR